MFDLDKRIGDSGRRPLLHPKQTFVDLFLLVAWTAVSHGSIEVKNGLYLKLPLKRLY